MPTMGPAGQTIRDLEQMIRDGALISYIIERTRSGRHVIAMYTPNRGSFTGSGVTIRKAFVNARRTLKRAVSDG